MRLRKNSCLHFAASALVCCAFVPTVAQEPGPREVNPAATNDKTLLNDVKYKEIVNANLQRAAQLEELYDKFERLMTGAKLTGQFTVEGKPMDKLSKETYEISKVKKLPEGDKWEITARIVYGDKDYEMPVPIDVKWAGDTPVLVLDNMLTPFGSFGARVVFHKNKYAGTWRHDDVGGHMFGMIEFGEKSGEDK